MTKVDEARGSRIAVLDARCAVCNIEAWVETVGGTDLCTQHYEEQLELAIREEEREKVRAQILESVSGRLGVIEGIFIGLQMEPVNYRREAIQSGRDEVQALLSALREEPDGE